MTRADYLFDDLTPDHFMRSSSTNLERVVPTLVRTLYFRTGEDGFDIWLSILRNQFRRRLATLNDVEATAILMSEDKERTFTGEGDEYPTDFASRLQREAVSMNAERSFVAMMAPVRDLDSPDHPIDPNDLSAIDAAINAGHMNVALSWVATSKTYGHRGGVIFVDETGSAIREIDDLVDGSDPFLRILD